MCDDLNSFVGSLHDGWIVGAYDECIIIGECSDGIDVGGIAEDAPTTFINIKRVRNRYNLLILTLDLQQVYSKRLLPRVFVVH